MPNIILTSSFSAVAKELQFKKILTKENLQVAFIPTAADLYTSKPWTDADRKSLIDLGYTVYDVEIKNKSKEQLISELLPANIIFVGGGNTSYLFQCVHKSGFDAIIKELIKAGRIYIGSSAGSILAGPSVGPFIEEDTEELPKGFKLDNPNGLNLVDYIVLPHHPLYEKYDNKAKETFGDQFKFVSITDNEYKFESF